MKITLKQLRRLIKEEIDESTARHISDDEARSFDNDAVDAFKRQEPGAAPHGAHSFFVISGDPRLHVEIDLKATYNNGSKFHTYDDWLKYSYTRDVKSPDGKVVRIWTHENSRWATPENATPEAIQRDLDGLKKLATAFEKHGGDPRWRKDDLDDPRVIAAVKKHTSKRKFRVN